MSAGHVTNVSTTERNERQWKVQKILKGQEGIYLSNSMARQNLKPTARTRKRAKCVKALAHEYSHEEDNYFVKDTLQAMLESLKFSAVRDLRCCLIQPPIQVATCLRTGSQRHEGQPLATVSYHYFKSHAHFPYHLASRPCVL